MRVIVTGSRKWADRQAVYDELNALFQERGPFQLIHGGCSTGADAMAHDWVELASRIVHVDEKVFKANWERGRQAGPERNARMIEAGADLVLAFPLPEGTGTQGTIALARAAGIEVKVIEP